MNELIPKIKPDAPKSLKKNVLNKIKKENKMKAFNLKHYAAVAAILVAVLIIPLLLDGNGSQAKAMNLLETSISKLDNVKTMVIKYFVRTLPADNFDYIDYKENFVEHTMSEMFENQAIFRVEKPQRVAIFDGKNSYLWIKTVDEVFVMDGIAGIYGKFNQLLLNPKTLLENAKKTAESKAAKIEMNESKNQIRLSIEAKAEGNFSQSDYLKNSSIDESNSRQVYVFDKTSKLLQSVEISILIDGKYVVVMKTEKIDYNIPLIAKTLTALPDSLTFKPNINDFQNPALTNISAKQAVEIMLNALKNNDIEAIKEGFIQYPKSIFKKCHFLGLEIISIGEAFKSGQYKGEFVPVKVRLSDGNITSINLAVRNDNPNKVWILDGGI